MSDQCFFFWGIFKNIDTIKSSLKQTPSRFIDAYFDGKLSRGYNKEVRPREGKYADFSHLSRKEFNEMVGTLAFIEFGYKLVETYVDVKDIGRVSALMYISDREYYNG